MVKRMLVHQEPPPELLVDLPKVNLIGKVMVASAATAVTFIAIEIATQSHPQMPQAG
jgi:hypothetical protein